jgi:hypothetical protein
MYNISKKYRSVFLFIAKLAIVTAAFYIISGKIVQNGDLYSAFHLHFLNNSFSEFILISTLIFLFTTLNWFLEIKKWKTLVSGIKTITFFEAFKQSTSSLTASLITPNRIGEYGAKAIYYPKSDQKKIMALNLLGNSSQMLITILFGITGLFFLGNFIGLHLQIPKILLLISLLITVFFIIKRLRIFKRFTVFIKEIPLKIHLNNLFLSFLRYVVFSHQFYFLLMIFGVELDYLTAMSLIFSMYLISSVIPGFVLFDFIIKGSVAVSLFGFFEVNEIVIIMITTLMWIMNFAIPALIGSYFVLTFNLPLTEKIPVRVK